MQKLAELVAFVEDLPARADRRTAYRKGYETYRETAQALGVTAHDPASFATYLALTLAETGEQPDVLTDRADMIVRVGGWRPLASDTLTPPFPTWTHVWKGALAAHNANLSLRLDQRMDRGDAVWQWRITTGAPLDA